MSEPIIRRATAADAETLVRIGIDTFRETFEGLYSQSDLETYLAQAYDLERTRADLADPGKASWLVEADGQAIGYATVGPCGLPHDEVTPACGELKRIYVRKAWQGSGLAARLLDLTMAWLQREGPRTIWLGVWSENVKAQRFYAKHGFAKAGTYDFHVARQVDLEYIFRRPAHVSSTLTANSSSSEHNPA
jgi:ribosomal protein S18 acetylase RimI-like enzyme